MAPVDRAGKGWRRGEIIQRITLPKGHDDAKAPDGGALQAADIGHTCANGSRRARTMADGRNQRGVGVSGGRRSRRANRS
jgi:hypothetical protein